VQKAAADAGLAPKLIEHPGYAGPLSYAYHFDAVLLGRVLRDRARSLGVRHVVDTVTAVDLAQDGAIAALRCREGGTVSADLYVDCTGMRAQLIGEALGVPFRSRRAELFVDRAVAIQIPYADPAGPIAAQTFAVAQPAGWIWDIGLRTRRGTGYVYSSDHVDDAEALATLHRYIGPGADRLDHRLLRFEAGYRETQWHRNCVAIGLSGGFIEPLEATGIGFAEIAAMMLVNLFPWAGTDGAAADAMAVNARQFNAIMTRRYDHVVDFIKVHYALSRRDDSGFWRDNRNRASWSPALADRLERWRYRTPDFLDVDLNHDIFLAANWQYVLYGMGYRTDLSAQAGTLRYRDEARRAFAEMREQQANALRRLPPQRALVTRIADPRARFAAS
jgi:flavin-dependent dehydrogenase